MFLLMYPLNHFCCWLLLTIEIQLPIYKEPFWAKFNQLDQRMNFTFHPFNNMGKCRYAVIHLWCYQLLAKSETPILIHISQEYVNALIINHIPAKSDITEVFENFSNYLIVFFFFLHIACKRMKSLMLAVDAFNDQHIKTFICQKIWSDINGEKKLTSYKYMIRNFLHIFLSN